MLMTTGFVFATVLSPSILSVARAAAAPGQVVINEIAWAGSADSSTDEWIELYNNSNQALDLSNWHIDPGHTTSNYKILSGTISAHGYFLIEDHESAVSNITADAIIHTSLINGGDSLKMYDSTGQLIDTVNGSAGPWYAGNTTQHATMERIDPSVTADVATNWASSTGGSGAKSSNGTAILGTPGAVNSKANGSSGGASSQNATVDFAASSSTLQTGSVLTLTSKVSNAQNLFAYGFEITYDPAVLHYESASEQSFLSENGTVSTSFQSDLQNGQPGTLLIADARTVQPKTGVNGNGDLFQIQFDVLQSSATAVQAANTSFLASTSADIQTQFNPVSLNAQQSQLPAVVNFSAAPGPQRYSIVLTWGAVAGADKYRVYRKDAHGQLQQIAETTQTTFTDADGVQHGGFIIPSTNYVYRVTAVQGSAEGVPAETAGHDDRGLKGDNNRSDRVDGRDLELLAQHFAETDADQDFAPLLDTTYDGRIDGSDLIDLGANFARTYSS